MMSCGVASWLPHAVAETLRGHRSAAPLAAWLTGIRAAPEEYDTLVPVAAALEPELEPDEDPACAFDGILSQLGREIYQLEIYQRNLNPPENEEISLSILNIFDECLGEIVEAGVAHSADDANSDNCEPSDCENGVAITNGDAEPPIVLVVNGELNEEEDFSDCASTATLSDASFVTSTPAKIFEQPCDNNMFDNTRPPPVPPRRLRPKSPSVLASVHDDVEIRKEGTDVEIIGIDSDRDSVSTCWSYKDCSADENDAKDQYAVVWSHSSGFHNSDEILRKVLSQNHATVTELSFDTASEFAPTNFSVYALPEVEVGDRCAGVAASVGDMTADRPTDDGYEPVRDAITHDENIYEEIEYSYSYTDEGCSCGGSVEVESCSVSASSEGAGRESPVYANLRDHDAYAIPPDVIAWKNLLWDPFYNEDEEDEWITPEECAVYSREQRPPLVIPRITQCRPRLAPHAYPEEVYNEPKPRGYSRLDASPRSERGVAFASAGIGSDGPPYGISKRLGGSTENLLSAQLRRPTQLHLPASSSGDSLDNEIRPHSARSRKSKSMVAPKQQLCSPVPAPRVLNQPVEAAVVFEGPVKRTKFSENGKKCKKNWTECYMLLTQTALVFYKDHRTYLASRAPKPAGTPPSPTAPRAELVLPLQNAHVVPCIQMHTRRYQRSLLLTVNYDHYLLQDEAEEGAKRWLNRIQNIIFQLGPPLMEEQLTPHYQSSSTDLESLGRTPPVTRHNKGKQKGNSSSEDLSRSTEEVEGSIKKSHVTSRLLKFFARRPPMEVLVKKGIYKDEPVFGTSLETACPKESPRVPEFVVDCVREIERTEENMCTDGLYRASGNLSQVQKIRLEVDQKNLSVIKNSPDIHVLTGSLKLFFRELKEPLIPCGYFDRVLAACSIKSREARIREFRDIVMSLPQCNRDTLRFLLEHLLRVTQYSEKNRMHTANLAIVFGPTLLWAPAAQAHNIAVDCIQQNHVVEILLTDFKEIFQEEKGKKKV